MQITTHMVFFVVKLLNFFPVKCDFSYQYSPKVIMSGETINYKQYCLLFSTYCQVCKEDSPQNSMAAQTQGAISLGPSNNWQGAQKFYTLTTGKVVVRRSWNVIPMTNSVIAQFNQLRADQPQLLTFYDQNNQEIGDEDAIEPNEDTAAEEMPGVVWTDLQVEDNAEMVKDNIKITGVDPGEIEDYPKIDLNIDLPPSRPTTKPNNESVPAFEPTDAGINKVPTLVNETVQEPTPTTPIIQATKESPC
jgi:hypothetical protein